ncbi:MAG: hypothetical protein JNK15_22100 [Planctomycetes bacterium]|nr:hypothetical protein [Planctomycetota bacterium]
MNWPLATVAASFCLPLLAQDPSAGPQPDARVEARAQSMREQLGHGRPVQSHVRVLVRLKNGNRLTGVVKDGRLVERVDGLRFVDAQAQEKGAGIRLWYSSGARNYVFVPFGDFAEYEVLQQLSQKQLEQIEGELQMDEKRAAERQAEAARRATGTAEAAPAPTPETPAEPAPPAEPAATTTTSPSPNGGTTTTVRTKKPAKVAADAAPDATQMELALHRTWFALVQEFPPAAGWNAKKCDEIKRRLVVVGSKPSAVEQKFVDNYDQWVKACAHFEAEKAPGSAPAAETGDSTKAKKKGRK